MAKTGTQLITSVRDNLGNVATGTLGSRSLDDAILDKVNDAIRTISRKEENLLALHRRASISVTTATNIYAFPTTDVDSSSIYVRNIFGLWGLSSSSVPFTITQITAREKLDRFPLVDSTRATGWAKFYTVFGCELYFYPFPNEAYTVNMWCNIWLPSITINEEQGLGTEFDDVIEACATMMIWAAKQSPDDYAAWRNIYKERLAEALAVARKAPDLFLLEKQDSYVSDPQNDPFVKSWNSR